MQTGAHPDAGGGTVGFVRFPTDTAGRGWTMVLRRKRHQRRRKDCPRRDARRPGASPRRGSKRDLRVGVVATRRCSPCRWVRSDYRGARSHSSMADSHYAARRSRYREGDVTIVAGDCSPARQSAADPNVLTPAPPFDSASAIGRSPDATVATTPATLRTGARLVRRARCSGASRGFCVEVAGRGPRGWACRAACRRRSVAAA
jgi:hypothetical protein